MKLLLEIKDNKAAFFMELLKNFSYVKAKPIEEVSQKKLKTHPSNSGIEIPVTYAKNPDVLALKGIWKNKKITQTELRKKAWGNRI